MSAEQEAARKLFAKNCDFVLAAAGAEQFPLTGLNDIAFIGRSNVGKSSLINAVTGRKNLARASNTPGRTQQIIFFNLGDQLMLVDLPGYGHAEAPRTEREKWNALMHDYLQKRKNLSCVLLLIDSRHAIKANDLEMMQLLDRAAVSYQIVLTKSDQLRGTDKDQKQREVEAVLKKHPAARDGILQTSAEKNTGIDELRLFLSQFAKS